MLWILKSTAFKLLLQIFTPFNVTCGFFRRFMVKSARVQLTYLFSFNSVLQMSAKTLHPGRKGCSGGIHTVCIHRELKLLHICYATGKACQPLHKESKKCSCPGKTLTSNTINFVLSKHTHFHFITKVIN